MGHVKTETLLEITRFNSRDLLGKFIISKPIRRQRELHVIGEFPYSVDLNERIVTLIGTRGPKCLMANQFADYLRLAIYHTCNGLRDRLQQVNYYRVRLRSCTILTQVAALPAGCRE